MAGAIASMSLPSRRIHLHRHRAAGDAHTGGQSGGHCCLRVSLIARDRVEWRQEVGAARSCQAALRVKPQSEGRCIAMRVGSNLRFLRSSRRDGRIGGRTCWVVGLHLNHARPSPAVKPICSTLEAHFA